MKTSKAALVLMTVASLALGATASAEMRTWTSADDPTKTFEGELVGYKAGKATIKRKAGGPIQVEEAKLAQADRDYIAKAAKELEAQAAAATAAQAAKNGTLAKALDGKLVHLEGKGFKKHDLFATKAPEYYLLYWGASW